MKINCNINGNININSKINSDKNKNVNSGIKDATEYMQLLKPTNSSSSTLTRLKYTVIQLMNLYLLLLTTTSSKCIVCANTPKTHAFVP